MLENIKEVGNEIVKNEWVEWEHVGVPNSSKTERDIARNLLCLLGHCKVCTGLDGCYFVDRNMPPQPLHDNCDCKKISLSEVKRKLRAECAISKFTKYVFTDEEKSKGKKAIFESMGFDIEDSYELKNELEKQSVKNYYLGNYILKDLDENGQRLAIPVAIKGKKFYTG